MNHTGSGRAIQQFGSLLIDHDAHEVLLDGHPVPLTLAEFTLLATLAQSPRRAFTNEHLTGVLTGSDWVDDNHALQVTVSRLRTKLGESGRQPNRVINIHGYGYRFEPGSSPEVASALPIGIPKEQPDQESLVAFALVDFDCRIVWASDSIEQLLGWRPSDLEGRFTSDFIHAEEWHDLMTLRRNLTEGHAVAMVLRLRTASGKDTRMQVLARPLIGLDGTPFSFLDEFRPLPSDSATLATTPDVIHLRSRGYSRASVPAQNSRGIDSAVR